MSRVRSIVAMAVVAACSDPAGPASPAYSLAGHWFVTGGATFDFIATDRAISDGARADSVARGLDVQAVAVGGQCAILRYARVGATGNRLRLRVACPGLSAENDYPNLPDTVRAFTAGNLTLEVR